MRVQSIDADGADLPWAIPSTAVFESAPARYIGTEIHDATNLALQDSEGVGFTNYKLDSLSVSEVIATSRSRIPLNSAASSHLPRSKSSVRSRRGLAGPPPSTPLPQLPTTAQLSAFTSRPISLIVGGSTSPSKETSPVTFHAHEQILTSISTFFRAALQQRPMPPYPNPPLPPNQPSGFLESTTGTITLPEERPEDIAFLLQWLYWRHQQTIQSHSSPLTSSPQVRHACLPKLTHTDSPTSDFGLAHPLIDPAVHVYHSWRSSKKLLQQTFGPSSSEVRACRKKRPAPPSFGPLVRLYLLADRYGVGGSLKWCICERVKWVGREANCVLEREDVTALWEGMVMVEETGVGLKRVVLEMFAGLRGGSVIGLFRGVSERNGEDGIWHERFLRHLVVVLFEGLEGVEKGRRRGGGCDGTLKTLEEVEESGRRVIYA